MLKAKTDLLDEVFRQVEDRIVQLPAEQYITLMVRLMTKAVETGDEEVIIGTKETRITADVITGQSSTRRWRQGQSSAQRYAPTSGRFILSADSAGQRLGGGACRATREATELEIAEKLFS